MPARRARSGRGWDAAPPRARRRPRPDATGGWGPDATGHRDGDAPGVAGGGGAAGAVGRAGAAGREAAPPPDPYEVAREICLRQLSIRPRTRAELATALRKRGVDDE